MVYVGSGDLYAFGLPNQ